MSIKNDAKGFRSSNGERSTSDPSQDMGSGNNGPNGFHFRPGSTWWGEALPTKPKGEEAIHHLGWWDHAKTTALMLWLGDGSVRALAQSLISPEPRRRAYATSCVRARWISDTVMGRDVDSPIGLTLHLLDKPIPSDRLPRIEASLARINQVAALVPVMGQPDDVARAVFRHLHVVEAVTNAAIWPTMANPYKLRIGNQMADGSYQTHSIVPDRREAVNLDARMRAAEGSFDA